MKKKISIVLNIILVILGIIGLYYTLINLKSFAIIYYTQQSNYLSIVSSLLYVFFSRKRSIPRFVYNFKYLTTLNLVVTFLVVLFILGPSFNFNYNWLLFYGSNLFYHLLCPIISAISFIFFEEYKFTKKDSIIVTSYTLLYGIVLILLNLFKIVDGPYPFLKVYENPIYMTLFYILVILGGCYLLSRLLCKIKKRLIVKGRH